jgi:hypothetical protein
MIEANLNEITTTGPWLEFWDDTWVLVKISRAQTHTVWRMENPLDGSCHIIIQISNKLYFKIGKTYKQYNISS